MPLYYCCRGKLFQCSHLSKVWLLYISYSSVNTGVFNSHPTVPLYSEADPKPEPVGGFNAVPFSYGNNEESNDQKNVEADSKQ